MQGIKAMFWDKKSQLEIWFAHQNFSSLDFIRFASFFGIGFLTGLFFKRWSKYIILVLVSFSILFAILHGFSIITINFAMIERLTGFSNLKNAQGLLLALVQTTCNLRWELGCSGIGFIIGFKTG